MEIVRTEKIYAILTIGLKRGYSKEPISVHEVLSELTNLQNQLIKESNTFLSANCFESMIVLSGQQEPHLNVKFINYPRFPMDAFMFKEVVKNVATQLMQIFEQNRLVIEYEDSFVMLQQNSSIDPSIRQSQDFEG